jgi:hypothetical protein
MKERRQIRTRELLASASSKRRKSLLGPWTSGTTENAMERTTAKELLGGIEVDGMSIPSLIQRLFANIENSNRKFYESSS